MRDTKEKQKRTLCFPITNATFGSTRGNKLAGRVCEGEDPSPTNGERKEKARHHVRAARDVYDDEGNLEGTARPALPFSECFFFSSVNDLEGRGTARRCRTMSSAHERTRPTPKISRVSPSLGVRAFPDPLPPAVVDELVERSSLRHRPRHRVERRTEGALELFLRPLRYDVVSAKVRTKETAERERGGARGEVGGGRCKERGTGNPEIPV